jgi:hypothetical protein
MPTYQAYAPVVQFSTAPGSRPYTTPKGVLTSWRYHSKSDPDPNGQSVRLELFKPVGEPGRYQAVAESASKTLTSGTGYEFFERIPVEEGWVLGLDPDSDAAVGITVPISPQDKMYQFGSDVPVGSTASATGPFGDYRVNVSATVEADADGDGYGDESQDQCPTDATTQAPCPDKVAPRTEITKHPKNRSHKHKAKFKFTADEPGTTFECKLKGPHLAAELKRFSACESPRKYKRLRDGKYRFQVRATDAAGNVDATPAKDRFRIVG